MHRLTSSPSLGRREVRAERGVTAVVVAIVMVILVGFAAIAVDVGALWWDRKQLQNGADAGALALAQSYAQGATVADPDGYATDYARKNKLDLNATGQVVDGGKDAGFVTVQTDTDRDAWFSRIWDIESSHVSAHSTARWGGLKSVATLPITTSECEFNWLEEKGDPYGKLVTIIFKNSASMDKIPLKDDGTVDCSKGPDVGPDYPGGFGWLQKVGCEALIDAGGNVDGKPGLGNKDCMKVLAQRLEVGEAVEVKMPVYNAVPGNKQYHISGFVTLKLTAVCFTPANYPSGTCKAIRETLAKTGNGNEIDLIQGTFVERSALSAGGGSSEENYGTQGVWLSWD